MSLIKARRVTPPARFGLVLASAAAIAVGGAAPVSAALQPEHDIELPAGEACEFAVGIDFSGGNRIVREFTDADGNLVRIIDAGRGFELTFTNLETEESVIVPTGGSVTRTTVNDDGTETVTGTGHNVLILFPSDIPEGPSTTLYVGRVVWTVEHTDEGDVFTLVSTSGRQRDLCAELA
jgi:hypothetical protein